MRTLSDGEVVYRVAVKDDAADESREWLGGAPIDREERRRHGPPRLGALAPVPQCRADPLRCVTHISNNRASQDPLVAVVLDCDQIYSMTVDRVVQLHFGSGDRDQV